MKPRPTTPCRRADVALALLAQHRGTLAETNLYGIILSTPRRRYRLTQRTLRALLRRGHVELRLGTFTRDLYRLTALGRALGRGLAPARTTR